MEGKHGYIYNMPSDEWEKLSEEEKDEIVNGSFWENYRDFMWRCEIEGIEEEKY